MVDPFVRAGHPGHQSMGHTMERIVHDAADHDAADHDAADDCSADDCSADDCSADDHERRKCMVVI